MVRYIYYSFDIKVLCKNKVFYKIHDVVRNRIFGSISTFNFSCRRTKNSFARDIWGLVRDHFYWLVI